MRWKRMVMMRKRRNGWELRGRTGKRMNAKKRKRRGREKDGHGARERRGTEAMAQDQGGTARAARNPSALCPLRRRGNCRPGPGGTGWIGPGPTRTWNRGYTSFRRRRRACPRRRPRCPPAVSLPLNWKWARGQRDLVGDGGHGQHWHLHSVLYVLMPPLNVPFVFTDQRRRSRAHDSNTDLVPPRGHYRHHRHLPPDELSDLDASLHSVQGIGHGRQHHRPHPPQPLRRENTDSTVSSVQRGRTGSM